jgi:hypothetical protein
LRFAVLNLGFWVFEDLGLGFRLFLSKRVPNISSGTSLLSEVWPRVSHLLRKRVPNISINYRDWGLRDFS